MYNPTIYVDWILDKHFKWAEIVTLYDLNLKRSFVFFTEDKNRQAEYLEYSKKYFNGG